MTETNQSVEGVPGPPAGRSRMADVAGPVIAIALVLAVVAVGVLTRGPASRPAPAGPARIAVVGTDGTLSVVDRTGTSTVMDAGPSVIFGFPAWSPDGRSVATIASRSEVSRISVYRPSIDPSAGPPAPVVVYESATRPAFYVYWAPDGRTISFLATDREAVALLLAPADGGAALDGTGPGAQVRRGAPLYYDWIDTDRLIVHVGTGPRAELAEIGRDGGSADGQLGAPGDFRAAMVSGDGASIAWVRDGSTDPATPDAAGEVVLSARDGSNARQLPVFGMTAAIFSPVDATLATIGADRPGREAVGFPLGPLRIIAADGSTRTLLDGLVLACFWAPDGRTIAAIRLQAPTGITAAEPSQPPATQPTLVFVDVASGRVLAQRPVRLGPRFVGEFLPYFDQYALSHRLWEPDSSSILLPIVGPDGNTHLVSFRPDGTDKPLVLDGQAGFWTP